MKTNQNCNASKPALNERVVLTQFPDGCSSSGYAVTVGCAYEVLDFNGSCLVTTTDVPGETAHIWRGRFNRCVPNTCPC